MGLFDFFKRKPVVAPTQPEAPTPAAPADPEWKNQQAFREGGAMVGYAAEQGLKTETQAPTAPVTASPEGNTDTRPEWIKKEEPRLNEGYAQEGIAQVPQVPQSSSTPPPTGEIKG